MAIDVRELKIGNWLETKATTASKFGRVTTIYTGSFTIDYYYPGSWFKPIPLTPEILEKCGFEHDKFDPNWFSADIGDICECDGGYTLPDSDGEPSLAYALKSLHQLQNLYYSLTGKELEINL